MSLTIMEVLYNAQFNLKAGALEIQHTIGRNQLDNAIKLLEKGKKLDDDFNEDDLDREGGK